MRRREREKLKKKSKQIFFEKCFFRAAAAVCTKVFYTISLIGVILVKMQCRLIIYFSIDNLEFPLSSSITSLEKHYQLTTNYCDKICHGMNQNNELGADPIVKFCLGKNYLRFSYYL